MKQGKGLGVCSGVAIGKVYIFGNTKRNTYEKATTKEQEQERFLLACKKATMQLQTLFDETKRQLGEEKASIIEVQLLMLKDEDFLQGVTNGISQGEPATTAVKSAGETMAQFFSSLDDPYMSQRASDILDVTGRILDILSNSKPPEFPQGEFIVVAEDLAPSQTISFPRDRILALVTQKGSASSHTAILARTLNIPSLVQADIPINEIQENTVFAVDATHNRWYCNPGEQILRLLREQKEKENKQNEQLETFRGKKTITQKGTEVQLFANIGSSLDIPSAIKGDAQGIGLMRTEFLYLGKPTPPSEEEQFRVYSHVAKSMEGKPVILRTLDIGADKQVEYLPFSSEENPALGLRGIRLCLANPQLFRTQLKAIYRASTHGNLQVMFPMISSLWEIQKAKEICESIRNELATQGVPVKSLPIGIMIETPAAALISDSLAREVDFFSVGTNDLIQYTLAVDRQNQALSNYADNQHSALWKLLAYIAKSAKKAGIWAGVCGELASNSTAIPKLIQLGYSELSMAPGKILQTRKLIFESEV